MQTPMAHTCISQWSAFRHKDSRPQSPWSPRLPKTFSSPWTSQQSIECSKVGREINMFDGSFFWCFMQIISSLKLLSTESELGWSSSPLKPLISHDRFLYAFCYPQLSARSNTLNLLVNIHKSCTLSRNALIMSWLPRVMWFHAYCHW